MRLVPYAARLAIAAAIAVCAIAPGATQNANRLVEPATGIALVLIPAGHFVMGSPPSEAKREPQERQHEVTLTKSFYLGEHEVTEEQWQRVTGANPGYFRGRGSNLPVERVNYLEVQDFLARLSRIGHTGAAPFRLPTEAEWEYACRAGSTTAYASGRTLTTAEANIDARGDTHNDADFRGQPTPVGSFQPNAWGLFDMHGNVWEWTADSHCAYPDGAVSDPRATCGAPLKVIRGGSWYFGPDSARCALRYTHRPQDRGFSLGFRIARDVAPPR